MTPCWKCGHLLEERDLMAACMHQELRPFGERTCICSEFHALNTCDCETCKAAISRDE
jgi:hypothetical protein